MKSTLIVAIVTAALVTASALPASAAKSTGSHIDSAEFNKVNEICDTYLDYYNENAKKLAEAKTKSAKATARENANWAINKGYAGGCAWVSAI